MHLNAYIFLYIDWWYTCISLQCLDVYNVKLSYVTGYHVTPCYLMLFTDSVYCYIPNGSFFRIVSELVAHLLFMFIPASGRTNPSIISHQPWNDLRNLWVFPKIMVPPNHPFFHRVFPDFHHPFWGTPIFGNIPIKSKIQHLCFPKFRFLMRIFFVLRNSGIRVSEIQDLLGLHALATKSRRFVTGRETGSIFLDGWVDFAGICGANFRAEGFISMVQWFN